MLNRQRIRRPAALLGAAALAAALLAACGTSNKGTNGGGGSAEPKSGAGGEQVVVGFATAQTGAISGFDKPSVDGALLAIADINKRGGLLGHPVKVVTADTHSDINQGSQAGLSVVAKGANVMVVTVDYNYGGGAARVAQQKNMIALSGAGSAKFGPVGIGPLAYTTGYSVASEGYADAEWAYKTKKFTSAYILNDNTTDADTQQCASFKQHWTELGGKVAGSDTFKSGDPSIAAQITRLKGAATKPDVVLLCSYPPGGATAVQQLRAAGVTAPILGEQAFDGTYWFEKTMPHLSNFYYLTATSTYGDDPDPAVNAFWKTYGAKYGKPTVSFGVNYYAGMEALAAAITKAGTTNGAAVAKQLDQLTKAPGLIPITWTPTNHILGNLPVRVMQVQNGKGSYLSTVQPPA